MFRARHRRMRRIQDAAEGKITRRMSDADLFKSAGITPKLVHRPN